MVHLRRRDDGTADRFGVALVERGGQRCRFHRACAWRRGPRPWHERWPAMRLHPNWRAPDSQGRLAPPPRSIQSMLLRLVGADQLRLGQHMALHGAFQRAAVGRAEVRQHHVQGVQAMEVAVPAHRRAGRAVAGALPAVAARRVPGGSPAADTASGSLRCRAAGRTGSMHPGHARRGRVGRVRVLDDQCQLRVPAGTPDQSSGGDTPAPSQLKRCGRTAPA